ncbi:carbonic anhydrase [Arthrobacter sp. V1I9]|jgi:carbonic anhydrase|uniref:carbonic anhydrase n=1 Tax=Arthrobacter sp. V1I9 TaxID=3042275 RepID=UPI002794E15E|nr:carbonic anhydrase [Arthrobacter sp. V1I9]
MPQRPARPSWPALSPRPWAASWRVELHAALLGLAVVVILLGWKHLPAAVRRVPGPLAAVAAGTALSVAFAPGVERISFSGLIFDAVALPELPEGNWRAVAFAVISMALIASIESLLSAVAVDKMQIGPRTNPNRELGGRARQTSFPGRSADCPLQDVNPNLITSSGPGDLLTLRNIGNVVCHDGQDASIDSAVSFAVNGLDVDSIVICGHSNCGAMKALLDDAHGKGNPSLGAGFAAWLDHARPSYRELLAEHPVASAAAAAGYGRQDQLAMVNVAVQLGKRESHPVAAPALAAGSVQATGLFYAIPTARVLLVERAGIRFLDPAQAAVTPISVGTPAG